MSFLRITALIGRIAGVLALVLGLALWGLEIGGVQFDLRPYHMVLGILLTLALLVFSLVGLFTERLRLIGLVSLLYALFVPYFGMNQFFVLVGDLHWLVRIAHLLVGIGAMALMQVLWGGYQRQRGQTGSPAISAGRE